MVKIKKESDTQEHMEQYPVLPLRNTILFPQQIIPIYIGRKQSLDLINDVSKLEKKYIVVVAQKDGAIENPSNNDIYKFGTLATVMKIFDMPDKSKSAIVQGLMRVKVEDITDNKPYFKGLVSRVRNTNIDHAELGTHTKSLRSSFTDSDQPSNLTLNGSKRVFKNSIPVTQAINIFL